MCSLEQQSLLLLRDLLNTFFLNTFSVLLPPFLCLQVTVLVKVDQPLGVFRLLICISAEEVGNSQQYSMQYVLSLLMGLGPFCSSSVFLLAVYRLLFTSGLPSFWSSLGGAAVLS